MNYLVRIDTPSVKKYVLANNTLKGIRGGSAILDSLNLKDTAALLDLEDTSVLPENPEKIQFYLGGGGGLVGFNDQEKMNEFIQKLKQIYFEKTGMSSVLISSIPYQSDQSHSDQNFQKNREFLNEQLSYAVPLSSNEAVLTATERVCELCRLHPVKKSEKHFGESQNICEVCVKKITQMQGKKKGLKKY